MEFEEKRGTEELAKTTTQLEDIETIAARSPKLQLTENQLKVMANKYLGGDAPELWMRRIARNIALAEVLYGNHLPDNFFQDGSFYSKFVTTDSGRILLLHDKNSSYSDRTKNFKRYVNRLEEFAKQNQETATKVKKKEEEFYDLLSNFYFLPNSPTLMNAGRDLQQLSGCFVVPVEDSIEGIYDAVKGMAIIHKSGGGTGFSFSKLRPMNDMVQTTKGVASGPLSFIRLFDTSTEVIKQGGTRRGANMGIMYYKHPDIKHFIDSKSSDKGFLQNFNISVSLDKEFFEKVKNNEEFELINPKDEQVRGKMNARILFDKIVQNAWHSADPGFVVMDRINASDSNPTPHVGTIESTNPCGEQPLLSWESCNLGSLNLSKFVDKENKIILWDLLAEKVKLATNFLDNVIDMNNLPLPEIEYMTKANRKLGLGLMGWAEMLVMLEIPYDSREAIDLGEKVMKAIDDAAREESLSLAQERGVFPNWKGSIFDSQSPYFKGNEYLLRNATRTTIAPTGTIAITAGLQGGGIEPFFAIVYKRYQAEGVDALKAGKEPDKKYVYYEGVSLFFELAEKHNYFGLTKEQLFEKISDNHGSLRGIKEIPEEIQRVFTCSHDVPWKIHIDHQAAFQKSVNNAVSKTINMSNSATVEDVEQAYLYAYETGCKGVTVYRDGCKEVQVLKTGKDEKKEEVREKDPEEIMDFSKGVSSDYYEVQTGYGTLHVNIVYNEKGPFRIFTSIPPLGSEMSGLVSVLGVFMSKAFQYGYEPDRALKHLNSAKGDKPIGFGSKRVDGIAHGVSIALRKHLQKTDKIESLDMFTKEEEKQTKLGHCPKCFSSNIQYQGGCSGPTCFDCGYSECS